MATSIISGRLADLIIRRTYTYVVDSLAANSTRNISGNDIGATTPEGYAVLSGRVYISGASTGVIVMRAMRLATGAGEFVSVRNVGSSTVTNFTVQVTVAYIKNNYWKDIS